MRNIILKYGFVIVAFTVLLSSKAEAKRFIGRPVIVKLTYSNVLTGTETVIERKAVDIRYSNNDQNCLGFKKGQYTPNALSPCKSSLGTYAVHLYIPAATAQFWLNDDIPARLLPSWTRIIQKVKSLDFAADREKAQTFSMQLHDNVPDESFHITVTFEPEKAL